jgi:membrane-associated protease RseP (regulator of RpoE activity)
MNGVDIGLFQFDYDLTWAAFFLNADEQIYSRYGGRDADDAEGLMSIAGLKYTMRLVLAAHQQGEKPPHPAQRITLPVEKAFPVKGQGCLHCHQVYEGLRKVARREGTFRPEMLWVYPLPQNIGLVLDVDEGNRVVRVIPDSPAHRAGLQPGDVLLTVGATPIRSQADCMYALHLAPQQGDLTIRYQRGHQVNQATIRLQYGWKKTDFSWRPSMRKEKAY